MTLYERKNNFNDNNMSLCEKGCIFRDFDTETKKVQCDCNIKNDMDYYSDNNNKNDLLNKIENKKSSSNLKVAICIINALSSPKKLFTNSGFITLLIILIIFIIVFILFCIKGKISLANKLDEIIYNKFSKKEEKHDKKGKHEKKEKQEKHQTKGKQEKKEKNEKNVLYKVKTIKNNDKQLEEFTKDKFRRKTIMHHSHKKNKNKIKRRMVSSYSKLSSGKSLVKNNNNLDLDMNIQNKIITKENNYIENIKLEEIPDSENDYELNTLTYQQAIKYDKRSCCDYYSSLLKSKQLFFFTFCSFNDCNSGIIKKFIFFLSFALHYTVSALFFNDENMHQIYQDEGKYNISYQIPKILISAVVLW